MRTRRQDGWLVKTKNGSWRAHWNEYIRDPESGQERRQHRSKVVGYWLASKTDDSSATAKPMTKGYAKDELQKIVSPLNGRQSRRADDRVSLRWFVEKRWRPTVEGGWAETTRRTNEHFLGLILAKFGDQPLHALDRVELQDWLNHLADTYSRSIVFHVGTCLKNICDEMVEQDYLLKDPGRKLKRPKTRQPDETILDWPQYRKVIDAAKTLRDKLAIKVGSGTGVRPGELFGFRWRSLEQLPDGHYALKVTETVYKAKLRPWAKTKGSQDYVPLPERLAAELLQWRTISSSYGDLDPIFPNAIGGFMDYENFEARVLDPIRRQLGLEKLNFQILRRTYASLAYNSKKGTLKDVQKQLRHSRPDTTLLSYVKEIPGSVYVMADAMWDGMFPQDGELKNSKIGELQTTAHILHTELKGELIRT